MPFVRKIKPIKGMPGYFISNDGIPYSQWRLRRKKGGGRGTESYIGSTMKEMRNRVDNHGYHRLALRKDGKYHYFLTHHLVLETFVGPRPDGTEGCHKNGIKTDNNMYNLYWGTRQQNMYDSVRLNQVAHGERNSQAVLTEEIVRNQVVPWLNDGISNKEVARRLKIHSTTIDLIAQGKNWKRVTEGILIIKKGHWTKRLPRDVVARKQRHANQCRHRNRNK